MSIVKSVGLPTETVLMNVLSIEMIILDVSTGEGVGEGVGVGVGTGLAAGAFATGAPQPAISKAIATANSVVLDIVKVSLPELSVNGTGGFVAQRARKLGE
jgi:hypothetical protein